MKRFMWAALASVGLGGWLAAPASAQIGGYQRPYQNPYPAFSPILNMGAGGNPATNYFGIVRPQMQTAAALQQLQANQQLLMGNQAPGQTPALTADGQLVLPTTGHPVGFNDYSRYFPLQGFRTGGTGNSGTGAPSITGGGGAYSNNGVRRY
jgi:hypothetical protein